MNDAGAMRAADRDREEVVDRLRTAMEDGRLTAEEYVDRVGLAYQATTYGDLAPLYADLPAAAPVPARSMTGPSMAPAGLGCRAGTFARLPVVLRVLWAIWLTAVAVNVVVWALVSITTGHLLYPWPLWVAGPYGAALFAVSVAVAQSRRASQP